MIYTANTVKHTDLSLTEDALYIPARERESSLLEDAYVFLYESDYNFNTIVNEINFHESAAETENAELVLEAADIKTIFNNIKDWIKRTWTRFVNWLKEIKNKIKNFFSSNKNKKKPDAKHVKEKLDEAKAERVEIKGVRINKKKIEEIQSRIENIDISRIENCNTVEEVREVREQITRDVIGGNTSASTEGLPRAVESIIGLDSEVNIVEMYDASDIIQSNENNVTESIDSATRVAKKATEKANNVIDNVLNDKYKDPAIEADKERYAVLMAQADAFRYCANIALTVSTATAKAAYIDTKQIAELSSRVVGEMKANSEDVKKAIEFFRSVTSSDGKSDEMNSIVAHIIDDAEKLKDIGDKEDILDKSIVVIRRHCIRAIEHSVNRNKFKLSESKKVIETYLNKAKELGVPVKDIEFSAGTKRETDFYRFSNGYYSLLKDLIFDDSVDNLTTLKDLYHFIEVGIAARYVEFGRVGEYHNI